MRARTSLALLLLCANPTSALADERGLVKQISLFTALTGTLSLLILLSLMLIALSAYATIFMPLRAERTREAQRRRPLASFFLGLLNMGFFLVLTAGAGDAAVIPGFALLLLTMTGLAAKGLDMGHRALRASGYQPSLLLSLLAGIPIVLVLCAIPFVGWFVLLPCFAAAGLGGAMLSFLPAAAPTYDPDAEAIQEASDTEELRP